MSIELVQYALNEDDGVFKATFPPAYADGRGVMEATIEYAEDSALNAWGRRDRAYYRSRLTVDGEEVFSADDIGSPLRRDVDSERAFLAVLPAVITFGSAYEGSGHGEVCNTNAHAYEHSSVFQLAGIALESLERSLAAGELSRDH